MRSIFHDIHRTVMNTMERSGYSLNHVLKMLGISRSWYYSQMDFSPILDGRFNPLVMRNEDEWIVIGYKNEHPAMSFREIAYTLIDEEIAYLSHSGSVQDTEEAHHSTNMPFTCATDGVGETHEEEMYLENCLNRLLSKRRPEFS